ncbi:MAG: DUF4178 domain-containing protein [Prevotella sp.]|nr:DUF4178 domain-containing protein [Prevotella sp.]
MERIYQLKRNDSLQINSRSFLIKGVMELKQGAYQWKEFLLTDTSNGEEFWFNIELSSQEELILYKVADPALFPKPHDEGSSILEEGDATVINKSGISDVTMGNEVHFIDYESVHDNQHVFSSETWGRYSEFYVGERVLFENIKSGSLFVPPSLPVEKKHEWEKLPVGQKLKIKGKNYTIVGYVKHKHKNASWTEYKLDGGRKEYWLSVEKISKENYEISLSYSVPYRGVKFSDSEKKAEYNNIIFGFVEKGQARVADCKGDVDFDYNESFSYKEYRSTSGEQLSVEIWEDETEASLGEEVWETDIELLGIEHISNWSESSNSGKGNGFKGYIWTAIVAVVAFVMFWPSCDSKHPIKDGLKSNAMFAYETSVTSNNKSNTKSDIYRSDYDPDGTCKIIIDMDPENVKSVVTSNDSIGEDLIMVQTDKETALIYMGEDGNTMVQIDKKGEEPQEEYSPYRAYHRHRMYWFFRSVARNNYPDHTTINTTKYDNYVSSARQSSIYSRSSQGGGTSFGK